MTSFFLQTIPFGELELSNTTVIILISISVFIFLSVGLSSFKLIQTALSSSEEEDK